MNGYDRTWPTAVAAIGLGSLMGWAAFGSQSFERETVIRFDSPVPVEAAKAVPVRELLDVKTVPTAPRVTDRARQIQVLAGLGPDGLLELLRTGQHAVDRRNAAVLLGAHPRPQVVMGALMIALRTDDSPEVRVESAESLGRLGVRDAMGPLHLAATLDGDAGVREAAVAALGRVGQSQSIPILSEVLRTDPSEYVRAQAVRSLMAIGDKDAWDAVRPTLGEPGSDIVGRALAEALGSSRGR